MPMIEITDSDFSRMQKIAKPLVDTPATIVSRLLDTFEASLVDPIFSPERATAKTRNVFPFDAAPPLVHVKFLSGTIGGDSPRKQSWDSMVALCLRLCLNQYRDVQYNAQKIDLNVVSGRKTDEGYKFIEEQNVSYQGVSAQHAATVIGKSARLLQKDAKVEFIWRQKEEAHAPGVSASLVYSVD